MSLFGQPNIERLKDKRDLKGLIEALGYQKDARIRKAAAAALGELRDPAAVGPLIVALGDGAVSVRMTAAKALEKIRMANEIGVLDEYIEHVKLEKRKALKAKIERYKATGNAKGLIRLLPDKDLDEDLEEVTQALVDLGMKALVPLYLALGDQRRIDGLLALNRKGQLNDFVIQMGIRFAIADYLYRFRKERG
jgi:HEAT repeat protein